MYELGRNDVNSSGVFTGAAAGIGSMPMNQPLAAKRIPQVAEQVDILMKRIELLHQTTSLVEQRMSSALVPEPPQPASERQTSEPSSAVALAAQLMTANSILNGLHGRLNSLLQRIEL